MESTGLDEEKLDDLNSRKDVVERIHEELYLEKDGLEKVALNRITVLGLGCSDSDEESISSNQKEGILTETKNRIEEPTGEFTSRSEEIMKIDECMSEGSNQREGVQGEASIGLDCEALPTSEGDMNAPIDIESDSIVEISDSEDSLRSDDDSPPNNRLERPLSGQICDEHLISCKEELPDGLTLKRKWDAETGTNEIKTEGEAKRSKIDAAQDVMQAPILSPPSQNIEGQSCKEGLPHSLTSKRKWGAETGMSEIWTDDENKRKKLDAAPFSMEMETSSLYQQSRNIEGKSGQTCDEHLISYRKELVFSSTPRQKWGAETGKGEIKTEGEDKRNKPDERLSMELPYSNCRKELPYSLTPKQGAETGTSEIRTEDEDKRMKIDAAQNLLVEPSSMQMQTRSSAPQSQNMWCGFSLFNESRLKLLVCVLIYLLTSDGVQSF